MHVHLAEVFGSLMGAIVDVHNASLSTGKKSSFIVCAGKQTNSCKPTDKGDDKKNIKVTLVTASSPGKAQPFLLAYGSAPNNKNPLVLNASTLVVRVPKTTDEWAIITNPTGPAECFFIKTADKCTSN